MKRPFDLREVEPCSICIRRNYDEFDAVDSAVDAGAYLVSCAMDGSSEYTTEESIGTESAYFMNGSAPTAVKGAIGHCGRKIGKGDCEDWKLMRIEDVPVIIRKPDEKK